MKKNIKLIAVVFATLFLFSCGEEETRNTSGARVEFKLYLTGIDNKLANLYHTEVYTQPRSGGRFVGIAGLLVFNYGYDDNALPTLAAFDLCCPYENKPTIRVKPTDRKAVCEQCKSEYDLLNGGRVVSGPATKRLWSYPVEKEYPYNGNFMIQN